MTYIIESKEIGLWIPKGELLFLFFLLGVRCDNRLSSIRGRESMLGRTIKIDETTESKSRGKYARICVEIDLNKPLLSKFRLRRRIRRIEYGVLYLICFGCGRYGHRMEECKENELEETQVPEAGQEGNDGKQQAQVVRPEIVDQYGPWMFVQKTKRRSYGKQRGQGTSAREVKRDGEVRKSKEKVVSGLAVREDRSEREGVKLLLVECFGDLKASV